MGIVFCCHEDYYDREDEKKVIAKTTVDIETRRLEIERKTTSPTQQEWDFCEEGSIGESGKVEMQPI